MPAPIPSVYLQAADYGTYGLDSSTTAAQIIKASSVIDGYIDTPEGLLYGVDGSNNPAYMLATGLPITKITKSNMKLSLVLANLPIAAVLSVLFNQSGVIPPNFVPATGYQFNANGRLWLPNTIPWCALLQVNYVAGYLYANLPPAIKMACANIVTVMQNDIYSGAIKSLKAGDTQVEYENENSVTNAYIDMATADMLAPYKRTFA